MNSALPADHAERARALDTRRSFIVRAPAGSGKTRLLIQRYLALLAQVDDPEEVVAITFTRKAAAEMRARVLAALAAAHTTAHATTHATEERDDATQAARDALARDAARGWRLLENTSRMRIQTIDSLNASLTRQMPLTSRFGAQPESLEDAGRMYAQAANAVLAEVNASTPLAADVGTLLAHLDNQMGVAAALIADMLASRDHWLRNLGEMQERERLEAALARVRADAVARASRLFPAEEEGETLALARFAGQNLAAEGVDSGLSCLDAGVVLTGEAETDLPLWFAFTELLLTKEGGWRKPGGLTKRCGFPTSKDKNDKARLDGYKARMSELLERLERNGGERLAAALENLRSIPPARYSEAQWQVLGAILRILPFATAELWHAFAQAGQCDFTEISQAASRALGSDDAPTDLALALDYRIRHFLVDEFQDTSFAQFELLEKLVRGWSADDGRTLFLVGDPMQSIYRFREAEVGLFLRARDQGIGGVALEPLTLTVNFRSRPEVVAWVNEAFAALMPAEDDDVAAGAVPYSPSIAFADAPGAGVVEWHPVVRRKAANDDDNGDTRADAAQREAEHVVALVEAARREEPADSVAILVRNRTHLAEIVPALKAAGIAFQAVDIDPLAGRPVVHDLLALTRALIHAADRVAWLAVLRAPWCGLTLNDMARLAGGSAPVDGMLAPDPRTVWEMVNDETRLAALSEDGRARLSPLRRALADALLRRRRVPLRELVESAWLVLDGPAVLPAAAALDDAAMFLDLLEDEAALQSDGSDIVDMAALQARVERLFAGGPAPAGDGPPPLQIMTIHKAKGLEFGTVIVPGLARTPRQDAKKLMVWTEQPDPDSGERELLLAPIQETGEVEGDAIYRYVQGLEREKQRHEDVRLMYVAATRAEKRLHLLATVDEDRDGAIAAPRTGSLAAALWPVVGGAGTASHPREPAVETPPMSPTAAHAPAAMRLARPFTRPAPPPSLPSRAGSVDAREETIDFEWAGETARHVGTVIHAYLQRFAEDGLAHWSAARLAAARGPIARELARLGVAVDEVSDATVRVVQALEGTLADERGRWLLDTRQDARSEWRLSGVLDARVRSIAIDRSFVHEGVRWIVDFKTGSHEGGDLETFLDQEQARYRAQLEGYATLLQQLHEGIAMPIRLGLYFPVLNAWREWAWVGA